MIESIEKLRELAVDMNSNEIICHLDVVDGKFMFLADWLDSWHKAFDAACDQIETEIADRYIELPVDADGVPIRLDDRVASHRWSDGTWVGQLSYNDSGWWVIDIYGATEEPSNCRHAKPRTVEDVLEDFAHNYNSIGGKPDEYELWDKLLADTSAELREMMGGER